MIRLVLGVNEKVDLTLREKVSIDSPNYLFEFISNNTKKKVYCIAIDTSLYPERYNRFSLTVMETTPDPLSAEIKLLTGDEYTYNVYEQESSTNLDPEGLNIVETGMMTYDKEITQRNQFNDSTTRAAFNG